MSIEVGPDQEKTVQLDVTVLSQGFLEQYVEISEVPEVDIALPQLDPLGPKRVVREIDAEMAAQEGADDVILRRQARALRFAGGPRGLR